MKKNSSGSLVLAQRLALAPYSIWAALFIVVPLIFVAYYAFTDQQFHFTMDNIVRFFTFTDLKTDASGAEREVHIYLLIFLRSLKLAVISTVICLIFGYPFAYMISKASPRTQSILITLIMIPMWMNFLIRTYAWVTLLQDTGVLNRFSPGSIWGRSTSSARRAPSSSVWCTTISPI